jgi:hypothetical protein
MPSHRRIEFQALDGVDGIPTAEHVIPLQHLMPDAIEETAQSGPKKMPKQENGGL